MVEIWVYFSLDIINRMPKNVTIANFGHLVSVQARIFSLISINICMSMVEIWVFFSLDIINRMPKIFTIANFGQPVSLSWLRPYLGA